MPQPSLIESYLAGMRAMLHLPRREADRILEEVEDHLSRSVLEGVESRLSLREAEERAIARFGLPGDICARFRPVYRPWHRRPLGVLCTVIGGLGLAFAALQVGPGGVVVGLLPFLLGALPSYRRRNARAGLRPGLTACMVSLPVWLLCAVPYFTWVYGTGLPDIPSVRSLPGLLLADILLIHLATAGAIAAGAAAGARFRESLG